MDKLESYSITPKQIQANENVSEASETVLLSYDVMIKEGEFEAVRVDLIGKGLKIWKNHIASQKMLLKRCVKLSEENESLKMMYSSVMQERKDQLQNQKYMLRLIEENEKLKKQ